LNKIIIYHHKKQQHLFYLRFTERVHVLIVIPSPLVVYVELNYWRPPGRTTLRLCLCSCAILGLVENTSAWRNVANLPYKLRKKFVSFGFEWCINQIYVTNKNRFMHQYKMYSLLSSTSFDQLGTLCNEFVLHLLYFVNRIRDTK